MIQEIYPEYNLQEDVSFLKKKLIKKASKIIAISHNTKKDIIELCDVPEEKIVVAHLANSSNLTKKEKVNNLPKQYFLYVGNRSRYKNFYFLAPLNILKQN